MKRLLPLALAGALAFGCGSLLGISDVPEPARDAGVDHVVPDADATPEDAPDGVVPDADAAGCSCDAVVPADWSAVAYADGSVTCPGGFGAAVSVQADPTASAGACDCQATAEQAPSCANGSLTVNTGGNCTSVTETLAIKSTSCEGSSGTIDSDGSVEPLAASGGSCTGVPVKDPTKLVESSATLCSPTACSDALCNGQAPSGFTACVSHAGDVACPGGPFSTKHVIADSFTLDCDCSQCTASATCDSAVLHFYSDGACGTLTPLSSILADGACHATGVDPAAPFASVIYAVNTGTPSYAAGPKTPIFTPVNAKTVCCR